MQPDEMAISPEAYLHNFEVISNFPNIPNARISVIEEKWLERSDRGIFSNLLWFREPDLKETLDLIKTTSMRAMERLEDLFSQSIEESRQKYENFYQGLKNIVEVYSQRSDTQQENDIGELNLLVERLGSVFKQVPKIEAQLDDFTHIEEDPFAIDLGEGRGPNFSGKVYSGAVTGLLYLNGLARDWLTGLYTEEEKDVIDPNFHGQIERLRNPGMMIGDIIVNQYLTKLKEQHNFHIIHDFYLSRRCCIHEMTLKEAQQILYPSIKEYKDQNLPFVMPVVLNGNSTWERSHIVTILIKNGVIEYFDPKGMISCYQKLQDDNTFRDVLDFLNQDIYQGKGRISENTITHQFDANNCGVFACYYVNAKLNGEPLESSSTEPIPLSTILEFREEILKVGFMTTTDEKG